MPHCWKSHVAAHLISVLSKKFAFGVRFSPTTNVLHQAYSLATIGPPANCHCNDVSEQSHEILIQIIFAYAGGEWLFIFRDLGSTGNYFRGSMEQAHSFGDLGSPAKKKKK